jgi:hypothetical protein
MNIEWIRTGVAALSLFLVAQARAAEIPSVDHVTFKQGRILVPKDGDTVETTNDVKVAGNVLVATNGVFVVNSGKPRQLTEGQRIGADGMLASPDGTIVPVIDHLIMKANRVQIVKDGIARPLPGEFALPDGAKVTPDGTIRTPNGRLQRMLEGQLLKLDGKVIPVSDSVSLKDGKVILFKDGAQMELRRGQAMAMSDGTRVTGDGVVTRPDGTRITVQEGEIIRIPGVISPRR